MLLVDRRRRRRREQQEVKRGGYCDYQIKRANTAGSPAQELQNKTNSHNGLGYTVEKHDVVGVLLVSVPICLLLSSTVSSFQETPVCLVLPVQEGLEYVILAVRTCRRLRQTKPFKACCRPLI